MQAEINLERTQLEFRILCSEKNLTFSLNCSAINHSPDWRNKFT